MWKHLCSIFVLINIVCSSLWPLPQHFKSDGEYSSLAGPTVFKFKATGQTSEILKSATAKYLKLIFYGDDHSANPRFNTSILSLNIDVEKKDETLALETDESYSLTVSAKRTDATLVAPTIYGALRGLETFSQLVEYNYQQKSYSILQCEIDDSPRFQHRGFLIDSARHFLSVTTILQFIDALGYNKFNVLHWHIVDSQSFPFQSTTFPDLSGKGAYSASHTYSPSDVQTVIKYAKFNGIRVLVEFDTPGHVSPSWGKGYPKLLTTCSDGSLGPVNPTTNYTFQFLSQFFKEISDVFPDKYIHVGGDEVSFRCWESNSEIQKWMSDKGWSDYSQLEQYYEKRLLEIAASYGHEYIIWQDVFDNDVKLRQDTVIHIWKGGDNWQSEAQKVTKAGYKTILSSPWYLNYIHYGEEWKAYYKSDPQNFPGTSDQKKLVMGGEACMWGEFVDNSNLLSRSWVKGSAIGERLWSAASVTDENKAAPRLHAQQCRMVRRGIPAEPQVGPNYCDQEFVNTYKPFAT